MSSLYAHKKQYELRYSDLDFNDRLKPSALLSLFQESACLSADELGFGYYDLKPKSVAFVIVNTYCKFIKPVVLGELCEVETWPLPPRHFFFERDYRLTVKGEVAAVAASRWCLVDFESFGLRGPDILGKAHEECPYRDEKVVDAVWKLPKGGAGKLVCTHQVTAGECDHYFHANNTRYADYFFDCFSMDELSRSIDYFQIAYDKQAKVGSTLEFYREDIAEGTFIEARIGETVSSRFFVRFAETA